MSGYESPQRNAQEIFDRAESLHKQREVRRESLQKVLPVERSMGRAPGLLVAEGDSWFDYPGTDVLEELEEIFGYDVTSVAHRGDTLESMAYGRRQLDGLNRKLERIARTNRTPRAILLSAGGNDIAGEEFVLLLNHARSGLNTLNEEIISGLIDVRMRAGYEFLIRTIGVMCDRHFGTATIPVVAHGYDYPVADGRGFFGGWGPLPGPWLQPGFYRKGYEDLDSNVTVLKGLIDRFNDMLATLNSAADMQHVHHVDLRGTLSHDLGTYRQDWDNELHPENRGFARVAAKLADTIELVSP
jgi:lysophospholipase L1-like esterase